ncbi:Chromosome partition protein Smc [Carpediemonas membranifera]|uniref:Chromosome partition protein Smc n=1 Tax=Carpediemonas membranifera TaxID=201153 RepID=A0A8J6E250_9EUKA|nr:Chromosome partition protein Smc [Carpediemonas membranifera]|eukprot:KAG9393881.1 Chromosome partition protein Smc [Carpediemonas membranifera]
MNSETTQLQELVLRLNTELDRLGVKDLDVSLGDTGGDMPPLVASIRTQMEMATHMDRILASQEELISDLASEKRDIEQLCGEMERDEDNRVKQAAAVGKQLDEYKRELVAMQQDYTDSEQQLTSQHEALLGELTRATEDLNEVESRNLELDRELRIAALKQDPAAVANLERSIALLEEAYGVAKSEAQEAAEKLKATEQTIKLLDGQAEIEGPAVEAAERELRRLAQSVVTMEANMYDGAAQRVDKLYENGLRDLRVVREQVAAAARSAAAAEVRRRAVEWQVGMAERRLHQLELETSVP